MARKYQLPLLLRAPDLPDDLQDYLVVEVFLRLVDD